MVSNKTMDQYTLELEPSSSSGQTLIRATAQNTSTGAGTVALFSMAQIRTILARVYEEEHMKTRLEWLEAGQTVKLMATSKDPLIFIPPELVQFGFDSEEL